MLGAARPLFLRKQKIKIHYPRLNPCRVQSARSGSDAASLIASAQTGFFTAHITIVSGANSEDSEKTMSKKAVFKLFLLHVQPTESNNKGFD